MGGAHFLRRRIVLQLLLIARLHRLVGDLLVEIARHKDLADRLGLVLAHQLLHLGIVGQVVRPALIAQQLQADVAVEELREDEVDLLADLLRQIGGGIEHLLACDVGAVDPRHHLVGIGLGLGGRGRGSLRLGSRRRRLGIRSRRRSLGALRRRGFGLGIVLGQRGHDQRDRSGEDRDDGSPGYQGGAKGGFGHWLGCSWSTRAERSSRHFRPWPRALAAGPRRPASCRTSPRGTRKNPVNSSAKNRP
jgi:hypothetical protein